MSLKNVDDARDVSISFLFRAFVTTNLKSLVFLFLSCFKSQDQKSKRHAFAGVENACRLLKILLLGTVSPMFTGHPVKHACMSFRVEYTCACMRAIITHRPGHERLASPRCAACRRVTAPRRSVSSRYQNSTLGTRWNSLRTPVRRCGARESADHTPAQLDTTSREDS